MDHALNNSHENSVLSFKIWVAYGGKPTNIPSRTAGLPHTSIQSLFQLPENVGSVLTSEGQRFEINSLEQIKWKHTGPRWVILFKPTQDNLSAELARSWKLQPRTLLREIASGVRRLYEMLQISMQALQLKVDKPIDEDFWTFIEICTALDNPIGQNLPEDLVSLQTAMKNIHGTLKQSLQQTRIELTLLSTKAYELIDKLMPQLERFRRYHLSYVKNQHTITKMALDTSVEDVKTLDEIFDEENLDSDTLTLRLQNVSREVVELVPHIVRRFTTVERLITEWPTIVKHHSREIRELITLEKTRKHLLQKYSSESLQGLQQTVTSLSNQLEDVEKRCLNGPPEYREAFIQAMLESAPKFARCLDVACAYIGQRPGRILNEHRRSTDAHLAIYNSYFPPSAAITPPNSNSSPYIDLDARIRSLEAELQASRQNAEKWRIAKEKEEENAKNYEKSIQEWAEKLEQQKTKQIESVIAAAKADTEQKLKTAEETKSKIIAEAQNAIAQWKAAYEAQAREIQDLRAKLALLTQGDNPGAQ